MKTTLKQAIGELRRDVPPPDDLDTGLTHEQKARIWINRVASRLISAGKWKGTVARIRLTHIDGIVALPREYETMLAFAWCSPEPIWNAWHEFHANGPGPDDGFTQCSVGARDRGDGHVTFRPASGQITVVGTEASGSITIVGLVNGRTVSENVLMTGTNTSTNAFDELVSVLKPVTVGEVTMEAGGETVARYYPGETTPHYRWYQVRDVETDRQILARVKRRHVDAIADNDLVWPANLEALRLGIMARTYETRNDAERANYYWGQAFGVLNDELGENRGDGQEGSIQIIDPVLQYHPIPESL